MVCNHHLKTGREVRHDFANNSQHSRNLFAVISRDGVGVSFGLRIKVSRKIHLRWLVEEKKTGNWSTCFAEMRVECKMCGEVIRQPVFTTSNQIERHWPLRRVCNNRCGPQIKPNR